MSESGKCDIKLAKHPVKIWELQLSGDCSETIDLIESLPPGKRRYLKKRTTILD